MLIRTSRRSFVAGLSAGAAALVRPFLRREAAADQGVAGPLRLVVIYVPHGHLPGSWEPSGSSSNFTLNTTMRPYEPLKSDMVVFQGINNSRSYGQPHSDPFIELMTGDAGQPTEPSKTDYDAQFPSYDQIFAGDINVVGNTRFPSLQMATKIDYGSPNGSWNCLSWAGPGQRLHPENRPMGNYQKLFGAFMPGSSSSAGLAQLIRERRSVLDALKRDWQRMAMVMPSAQKPSFDTHLDSIRRLEQALTNLSETPSGNVCARPDASKIPSQASDGGKDFPAVYRSSLELVRIALACDLSRVITFLSCSGGGDGVQYWSFDAGTFNSAVRTQSDHHGFGHIAGGDKDQAPDLSNPTQAVAAADFVTVDTWYASEIARFVTGLKAPDGAGQLLDNTLVLCCTEVAAGNTHSVENVPFVLFGRAGGLKSGRYLDFRDSPHYPNDLWVSVANLFGLPLKTIGNPRRCRGPLPGLV